MKSAEIRDAFLKYFASKNHEIVPSGSLVPGNDPSLLFTNAGMVQFKDVFLGEDTRSYTRAASSQRCVRAGGKHNDLENVGYTARHHTFFEMLGNFSFGDYFKREAIQYAWEFLTQVLQLPPERLWVTVHLSDDAAADIWLKEVGVSASRFSRLDEDNFWQMGDTGPCGPSSEIFYDHGENVAGGPPGSDDDDLDRYIEIWNLVFMQYERQADGELKPLPKPSVDTGMGLERLAAVLQGVHSNYETDLFQALLREAAKITLTDNIEDKSLRVIVDHIRSCSFLVCDGVVPSNEGRGYVLRRIIRRAIRHGHKLGMKDAFFHRLVAALAAEMGQAYPELSKNKKNIERVLLAEEEQFAKTLGNGLALLEQNLQDLEGKEISGETVFKLYDTFGFPVDLTNDIARERGYTLDTSGYEKRMAEQKRQSRSSGAFKVDYPAQLVTEGETRFVGYSEARVASVISCLLKGTETADVLKAGEEGAIVLESTPFYGESGGQIGDCGYIFTGNAKFEVRDCQKSGSNHVHIGTVLSGAFGKGDAITAEIDADVRAAIAVNHSATHLLHAALREVLGEHVTQKGSLVDSERLRFDYSHFESPNAQTIRTIEQRVNEQIRRNTPVETALCDMETAKEKGAMALFGEKYGTEVRVLSMGDGFSVELCGGTHVRRTGDIGWMCITVETGIAAGIRRIEAVTGEAAQQLFEQTRGTLADAAKQLKTAPDHLLEKLTQILNLNKQLEKENAALKAKQASESVNDWLNDAVAMGGVKVLAKTLEGVDPKTLRHTVDQLKNKLGCSAVLLASVNNGKVAIAAGVSADATSRIKAGDLVNKLATGIGGKGGGRPDMAQGGGTDTQALPGAMKDVFNWTRETLE